MRNKIYAPAIFISCLLLVSCSQQFPRYVNAKRTKPHIDTELPQQRRTISIPVKHADVNIDGRTVNYALSRQVSTTPVKAKNPKVNASTVGVRTVQKETATRPFTDEEKYANRKAADEKANAASNAVGTRWLVLLALIFPALAAQGKESWIGRLFKRKWFLRLLIAFHAFRAFGGFRTATKVIEGTLPGFAMIPALADFAIGLVALVLLVLSRKGGFKEMHGLVFGWNTVGWVDFAVALLLFLSHGMTPSIPIFIPLFFIVTHALIYIALRRKNYNALR